jgi:hypothetical protein
MKGWERGVIPLIVLRYSFVLCGNAKILNQFVGLYTESKQENQVRDGIQSGSYV